MAAKTKVTVYKINKGGRDRWRIKLTPGESIGVACPPNHAKGFPAAEFKLEAGAEYDLGVEYSSEHGAMRAMERLTDQRRLKRGGTSAATKVAMILRKRAIVEAALEAKAEAAD